MTVLESEYKKVMPFKVGPGKVAQVEDPALHINLPKTVNLKKNINLSVQAEK